MSHIENSYDALINVYAGMTPIPPFLPCDQEECLGRIRFDDGTVMNRLPSTRIGLRVGSERYHCLLYEPPSRLMLTSREEQFCNIDRYVICEQSCHPGKRKCASTS